MKGNRSTSEIVARNVRAEMAAQRWSGARLAQRLGISQSALSRRLTADLPFSVEQLGDIADVLNVPMSALLADRANACAAS